VDIRLTYGDSGVVLTVQDDGIGIADDRMGVERHWGLKGMRERALLIGATLSISGRSGGGTEVKVGIDADAAYPRH
jgi:signal transduction histidine kinase